MSLFKLFIYIFTLIGLLLFSGCGDSKNGLSQTTALGEATSILINDPNATMTPASTTLKSITSKLAKIVEIDVLTENQKDATSFTKEIRYCDISGVKEFEHKGTLQKIIKLEKFNSCKTTEYTQNGYITLNYEQLDREGKYPQIVNIAVNEDFTFNDILLKKGSNIESHIDYNSNKSIKRISIKVNGVVTYQYGTYKLINDQDIVVL